jgi:CheY-like chemotaxis protein
MDDRDLKRIGPSRGPNDAATLEGFALPRPFVLVVDDDEAARVVLSELLLDAGLDVVVASDGAEALDRLRELHTPRVVLLDLMMPRVGGWRVLAAMRENPRLAQIPVVVVTGCGERHYLPRGYRVLHKPIDAAVILQLVSEIVDHPAAPSH